MPINESFLVAGLGKTTKIAQKGTIFLSFDQAADLVDLLTVHFHSKVDCVQQEFYNVLVPQC